MTESDLSIEILIEDERWQAAGLEAMARMSLPAALAATGLPRQDYEISLLGCDDGRIAVLNTTFRGKKAATNILSWPGYDLSAAEDGQPPQKPPKGISNFRIGLGDIAISFDSCQREATDSNRGFSDHVNHLLIHGCLHLLGYDHQCDAEASQMEKLEVKALAMIGVANPY